MGDTYTFHLFNDETFYNKTIPKLQGNGDLSQDYARYVESNYTCIEEECDIALEQLIDLYSQMYNDFRDIRAFTEMQEQDIGAWQFVSKYNWYYDISAFFTHVVFTDCADYLPYYYTGRVPLYLKFADVAPLTENANEIISKFGRIYRNVFSADGNGVIGWISREETAELLYEIDELLSGNKIGDEKELEFAEGFATFLRVAVAHNLGVMAGSNLQGLNRDVIPQFKLTDRKLWDELHIGTLILQ